MSEKFEWTLETMRMVNELTPEIKGKTFDPGWFMLRQRFEQIEYEHIGLRAERDALRTQLEQAQATSATVNQAMNDCLVRLQSADFRSWEDWRQLFPGVGNNPGQPLLDELTRLRAVKEVADRLLKDNWAKGTLLSGWDELDKALAALPQEPIAPVKGR